MSRMLPALTAALVAVTLLPPSVAAHAAGEDPAAGVVVHPGVIDEDVLALWDKGVHAPVFHSRPNSVWTPGLTDDDDATGGDITQVRVRRLNYRMRTYFWVDFSMLKAGGGTFGLYRRKGAPRPPADYWTKPWFTVAYDVTGYVTDAEGRRVPTEAAADGSWEFETFTKTTRLRFTPPTPAVSWEPWSRADRSTKTRDLRTGHTICQLGATMTSANVVPYSNRITVRIPRAARAWYKVTVRQPWDTGRRGPQANSNGYLCLTPRYPARMGESPRRLVFPVRASVLDRTGQRVPAPVFRYVYHRVN